MPPNTAGVNLSLLYTELPFEDRFAAVKDDGFQRVEIWPQDDAELAVHCAEKHGLILNLLVSPLGPGSQRGVLGVPSLRKWSRQSVERTIDLAKRNNIQNIVILGGEYEVESRIEAQRAHLREEISWTLALLSPNQHLLIEPICRSLAPKPLVRQCSDFEALFDELGQPQNLRLLFDAFHVQSEQPPVDDTFQRFAWLVGHIQIADVPGRGEPGTGAAPLGSLIEKVQSLRPDLTITLEAYPKSTTKKAVSAYKELFI